MTFIKILRMHLKKNIIGLKFYGNSICRFGEISLISMKTNDCTYLFDFLAISNEEEDTRKKFMGLLGQYLTNDHVKKIFHDCRFVSDILYHQYNINLSNVFDIDVKRKHKFFYNIIAN